MSDHRLNLINDPLRSETKDMCSKILCNRYAGKSGGFCWLFLIFHAVFARNCSPASSGRRPGVRGQRSGCAVTRIMQVGKVGRAGINSPESRKLGRWAEWAATHQNHASWEGGQSGQQLTRIMQVGKVGRAASMGSLPSRTQRRPRSSLFSAK